MKLTHGTLVEPSITKTHFDEKVHGNVKVGAVQNPVDKLRYWFTHVCAVPETNSTTYTLSRPTRIEEQARSGKNENKHHKNKSD